MDKAICVAKNLSQSSTISINEAREEGATIGLKRYFADCKTTEKKINLLPINQEIKEELLEIRLIRILSHLLRLAQNSENERNFVIAYLKYSNKCFQELDSEIEDKVIKTTYKITNTLNMDSYDTCVFWTFSPYLYKELLNRNIKTESALRIVLLWAKDGKTHKHGYNPSGQFVNLRMKKSLSLDLSEHLFALSNNPLGASHKFVEQESKKIVDIILD